MSGWGHRKPASCGSAEPGRGRGQGSLEAGVWPAYRQRPCGKGCGQEFWHQGAPGPVSPSAPCTLRAETPAGPCWPLLVPASQLCLGGWARDTCAHPLRCPLSRQVQAWPYLEEAGRHRACGHCVTGSHAAHHGAGGRRGALQGRGTPEDRVRSNRNMPALTPSFRPPVEDITTPLLPGNTPKKQAPVLSRHPGRPLSSDGLRPSDLSSSARACHPLPPSPSTAHKKSAHKRLPRRQPRSLPPCARYGRWQVRRAPSGSASPSLSLTSPRLLYH